MRGQVILLTAVLIAVAIIAVLVLQMAASSAPGFGGVRAAYGVFSRDVSRAVEAIASYVDYVGVVSLLNFTEDAARYGLQVAGMDVASYSSWLKRSADMACASMKFFVLNRAPLGLSVEQPAFCLKESAPSINGKSVLLTGERMLTVVNITVSKPPNGTYIYGALADVEVLHKDGSSLQPVSLFEIILPNKTYTSSYRVSIVANVSLLALAGLNITRSFSTSIRVLGVDSVCTVDVVCVNITVSRPYAWTAYFQVLNRTIVKKNGAWVINYTYLLADFDLVNYTEYSAVYKINVVNFKEYIIKAYVGNIPLYIPSRISSIATGCRTASCYIWNRGDVPVVLYNWTNVKIIHIDPSSNVTRVYVKFGVPVTYWIIHRNGWLNITNVNPQPFNSNDLNGVRVELSRNYVFWLYP